MTRYLIAGAAGMLGRDLQEALIGREVTSVDRSELDITDLAAVRKAVTGHDVIINAAAYTAVDAAEENEAAAYAVNAIGPRNLAIGAAAVGAKLVQISTDYVFDGAGNTPYPEDTAIDPLNAYGRTKAAGEQFVLTENPTNSYIVRTAWLYGAHGPNFGRTMLTLAADRDTVSVVADQFGQPTWTVDLARQIVAMLDADAPAGIYHGTNAGQTNWFGFAQAVFASAGLDPDRVLPTDGSKFVRPAPRPAYSVLGHDAWATAGLAPMRSWTEALMDAASHGAFAPS
ncbi:dTDP-4-dehydrorhamnose reductase [Cryobacterium adonitolivorans]|uniref:dTDP-4-dehydrorhamnose reductase n=1 Tax=Cryobacterium adonitolivorans TaxID=1259189 RepID=A0A4R8WDS3_9MICO|nr:dTDP-4-dehydrorhamnose reductase [Cryobacterium adonitolivorans]TFC05476.1 dTDP-4-dehydrorhamnose reductase [Cryobacterium adonitolivorans]